MHESPYAALRLVGTVPEAQVTGFEQVCAVMTNFFEEARRAPSITEVNVAAGMAFEVMQQMTG